MSGTVSATRSGVSTLREGPIARLVVDRPGQRNALDRASMTALGEALSILEAWVAGADPIRALVVHGGGGHFIAGGDLDDLTALTTAADGEAMARQMQQHLKRLSALPVPVIAAVEAFAIGGGAEVALACDLRIIGPETFLAFRQIDFGVTTAWGTAWRLTQMVGPHRARQLLWTGARVEATEAIRLGLADYVAPPGETPISTAMNLAERLATRPSETVRAIKALTDRPAPPEADEQEASVFGALWGADPHHEAVARWQAARAARARRARPDSDTRQIPMASASAQAAPGRFIVFEGIDGAGTTTQAHLLTEWLKARGRTVLATAQPSKGPLGTTLRQILGGRLVQRDGQRMSPESVACLFAADRADHVASEIGPALAEGQDVICDRYDHSSVAYQGAEGDADWVAALNSKVRRPDLVLFIRIDVEEAARRRAGRGEAAELYEVDAFQRRVASLYDQMHRWRSEDDVVIIDGTLSVEAVHQACVEAIEARWPGRRS